MPSTKQFPLHDNIIAGVDTTTPAHLIGPNKWRTQHNMRNTPVLEQVPHKYISDLTTTLDLSSDIRWLGVLPSAVPGRGKVLAMTATGLYQLDGTRLATLNDDGLFRRWATELYDGRLYYINDLNPLRMYSGGATDSAVGTMCGRYLSFWYDHAVIGSPSGFPNRVAISDLYDFSDMDPSKVGEADYYDLVEWQQADYPFTGVTGIAKLRGTLWVYTPTAIVPFQYVGLPKIIQLVDAQVVTRTGNTFPWSLVALDTVHFYYDYYEAMFMVFDGSAAQPIGEPIRQYMKDNLSTDLSLAAKMYGYVDVENREIWWPFVSTASTTGKYDKAVVLNYRYKTWFTASVENTLCFCNGSALVKSIADLGVTTISEETSMISQLGATSSSVSRIWGSDTGQILQEEALEPVVVTPSAIWPASTVPFVNLQSGLYTLLDAHCATAFPGYKVVGHTIGTCSDAITAAIVAASGTNTLYPPSDDWNNTTDCHIVTTTVPASQILQHIFVAVQLQVNSPDAEKIWWYFGFIQTISTNITQVVLRDSGFSFIPVQYGSIAPSPSTVIAADDPILESGDFHYGDIRTMKENDAMVINAALYTGATINVGVSGRNFLGVAPTFSATPNAVWNTTLQDAMSTYKAVPGRVFRYRFTLKNARLARFDAFSESVYAKTAEK